MQKQLYIIEYESARWCGGASHCVVWAISEDEAALDADAFMEESMLELFSDEDSDEEETGDVAHVVNWVKLMQGSGFEEYYADEQQRRHFYPCVNA